MNAGATMALVANTSGSISAFTISHERLTKVGTVELGPGSGPTDVVFSRDGRHAYAVERGGNKIDVLDVNGTKVTNSGKSFVTGIGPYGMCITPDGKYGLDTNLGGAATPEALRRAQEMQAMRERMAKERAEGHTPPRRGPNARRRRRFTPTPGTLALFNLETGKVVDSAVVGLTPENVDLSPDGKYAEVNVDNGAPFTMTAPNYNTTHGLMWVFAVNGGKLTEIAKTNTGHWCQGATWSKDDHVILLQCATRRDIEVYRFNGKTLTQDKSATLQFNARPGSISTATNQ